jgi:hypothetical protein
MICMHATTDVCDGPFLIGAPTTDRFFHVGRAQRQAGDAMMAGETRRQVYRHVVCTPYHSLSLDHRSSAASEMRTRRSFNKHWRTAAK